MANKATESTIMVEREVFEKDGKEYFSYFIQGTVRGQNVRIGVTPPDVGGYTVLDIVFNGNTKAKLKVTPFEMKSNDGEVIKGNSYSVYSEDEDGEIYECAIKPNRASDKSLLKMLIR